MIVSVETLKNHRPSSFSDCTRSATAETSSFRARLGVAVCGVGSVSVASFRGLAAPP